MTSSFTQPVQLPVTTDELSREVRYQSAYGTNILVWLFLFIYPFMSIPDYLFAKYLWGPLLLIRLINVLLIYIVYELVRYRNWPYQLPLHLILGSVSLTYAVLCNVVDFASVSPYFLLLSTIFLLINAVVYWEAINSYLHTALAITLQLLFFYLLNERYPLLTFFQEGAQVFVVVAICSAFIPRIRYRLLWQQVRLQLLNQHSQDQLQHLNEELVRKNLLISDTNGQLQRINEQKNNFIYIAGHDLKNLVGTIQMSVNELRQEPALMTTDQQEYVGFIAESTQRIQYLLHKLLDARDTEQTRIDFNYETFDINREIARIADQLTEAASQKGVQLDISIAPQAMMVRLDRVFAGQIFQNLIANAIKFSQPANTLSLRTRCVYQRVVFELVDPGQAIGQERLERMFHKLDELSHSSVNSPDRAGLGLSIALRLAEAMNGTLHYESNARTGNYYRVEFTTIDA